MSARKLTPPFSKIYNADRRFFQKVDIYLRRHTPSESARVICVIPMSYNNNNNNNNNNLPCPPFEVTTGD